MTGAKRSSAGTSDILSYAFSSFFTRATDPSIAVSCFLRRSSDTDRVQKTVNLIKGTDDDKRKERQVSQAADEDGIVAAKREVSKNKKYSSELDVWGNSSNCIPLVFEHFGRWGWNANQFLHELSDRSRDEDGKNSSEFITHWRLCFSVTLQRCNACVIRCKLERLPSLLEV